MSAHSRLGQDSVPSDQRTLVIPRAISDAELAKVPRYLQLRPNVLTGEESLLVDHRLVLNRVDHTVIMPAKSEISSHEKLESIVGSTIPIYDNENISYDFERSFFGRACGPYHVDRIRNRVSAALASASAFPSCAMPLTGEGSSRVKTSRVAPSSLNGGDAKRTRNSLSSFTARSGSSTRPRGVKVERYADDDDDGDESDTFDSGDDYDGRHRGSGQNNVNAVALGQRLRMIPIALDFSERNNGRSGARGWRLQRVDDRTGQTILSEDHELSFGNLVKRNRRGFMKSLFVYPERKQNVFVYRDDSECLHLCMSHVDVNWNSPMTDMIPFSLSIDRYRLVELSSTTVDASELIRRSRTPIEVTEHVMAQMHRKNQSGGVNPVIPLTSLTGIEKSRRFGYRAFVCSDLYRLMTHNSHYFDVVTRPGFDSLPEDLTSNKLYLLIMASEFDLFYSENARPLRTKVSGSFQFSVSNVVSTILLYSPTPTALPISESSVSDVNDDESSCSSSASGLGLSSSSSSTSTMIDSPTSVASTANVEIEQEKVMVATIQLVETPVPDVSIHQKFKEEEDVFPLDAQKVAEDADLNYFPPQSPVSSVTASDDADDFAFASFSSQNCSFLPSDFPQSSQFPATKIVLDNVSDYPFDSFNFSCSPASDLPRYATPEIYGLYGNGLGQNQSQDPLAYPAFVPGFSSPSLASSSSSSAPASASGSPSYSFPEYDSDSHSTQSSDDDSSNFSHRMPSPMLPPVATTPLMTTSSSSSSNSISVSMYHSPMGSQNTRSSTESFETVSGDLRAITVDRIGTLTASSALWKTSFPFSSLLKRFNSYPLFPSTHSSTSPVLPGQHCEAQSSTVESKMYSCQVYPGSASASVA